MEPRPRRRRNGLRIPTTLVALGLMAGGLGSCARETRYEVLTFFFTGVPPYDEWVSGKPTAREAQPQLTGRAGYEKKQAELEKRRLAQQLATVAWSHGPFASGQCQLCHALAGSKSVGQGTTGSRLSMPRGAAPNRLLVPEEQLCIGCHSEKGPEAAESVGFRLHGPVASGLCTACHLPHQSPRRYMLRDKDNIAMCTQCHAKEELQRWTPAHAKQSEADCLTCHNPHKGKTVKLLKSEYDEAKG